jgi:hypothetical protein
MRWRCDVRALLIAVTITAGCASGPVDADREYARDDARIRAFEKYQALRQDCHAKGGVLVVDGIGRFGPSTFDPRTARCTSGSRPLFRTGIR